MQSDKEAAKSLWLLSGHSGRCLGAELVASCRMNCAPREPPSGQLERCLKFFQTTSTWILGLLCCLNCSEPLSACNKCSR